ncbi:hypothetical protein [Halomarina rubra]|uniref:Uncharacterized protein n=1 Tax=Halomarina rubra TaxID=2071873 RepID=A0ABD6AT19_9EURY|nr:hypothetical protein [Halomarina rubra]
MTDDGDGGGERVVAFDPEGVTWIRKLRRRPAPPDGEEADYRGDPPEGEDLPDGWTPYGHDEHGRDLAPDAKCDEDPDGDPDDRAE